jgi:alginate O-acetyltransferase complex protein AlgI
MIFSSLQYLLFLPIVVLLYWRAKGFARLLLVVAASYFFYMSWLPVYGILLLLLSVANWILGKQIHQARKRVHAAAVSGFAYDKFLLGVGLFINLGCLCYYKYANFFIANLVYAFNWLRGVPGIAALDVPNLDTPVLNVILPLGISFFVFEFVHYLVDVYRGDEPINSWWEFAAFASFFPSQIAGPIKRYQDFVDKLRAPTPWSPALFHESMALIVQGLFKKVAIADTLGGIVFQGFTVTHPLSSADALIASVGFVIQVYCDFSGYTDMGRGSALLLGIRLPENFNLPYLSHDLADFWRRWHMSLSYWLRDYVYIPLGGSRCNPWVNDRNLFITMVACGLWHGADWHYVIFGCMQGVGLIVNRLWKNLLKMVAPLSAACNTFVGKQMGTFITMAFITISFIVFRAPDMGQAFHVFGGLFNFAGSCEYGSLLVKSGVLEFLLLYAGFWGMTELVRKQPRLFSLLSDPTGLAVFKSPIRVSAWTAAVVLMLAAKPIAPCPFVYFQF